MARFEDTPEWKRIRKWDPKTEQTVRPWTRGQQDLIRKLSYEVGAPWPLSDRLTAKQAGAYIDGLLSRKRKGVLGRNATVTTLRLHV